jgi:hypothetical protein
MEIQDNLNRIEYNATYEDTEDNKVTPDYDVILQVKPEKTPQIKPQIIDGQKCIVIPINENEQATVNQRMISSTSVLVRPFFSAFAHIGDRHLLHSLYKYYVWS